MNRKEYRVPLSDIPVIPLFITWESRNKWLEDHDVKVELDWADRESVDLDTAWRLNDLLHHEYELAEKQAQRTREHDAAVNKAQLEAEAIYRKTFEAVLKVRPGGIEAVEAARAEVVKFARKLPNDVANSVQMRTWTEIRPGTEASFG